MTQWPGGGEMFLITEHHATEAIHSRDFPAAETRLIDRGGRLFLESQRFDRSGEYGRIPMVSLASIDAEFTSLGSNWPSVMEGLMEQGLVSHQDMYAAKSLWVFGRFINNTDMHLGNLSLGIDGNVFRISPVYDMCSMGFAPRSGEVMPYSFIPPEITGVGISQDAIASAQEMARYFWDELRKDPLISDEFREFLARGNPIDLMCQGSASIGR